MSNLPEFLQKNNAFKPKGEGRCFSKKEGAFVEEPKYPTMHDNKKKLRKCPKCGKSFHPKALRQTYCSLACSRDAVNINISRRNTYEKI